MAELQWNSKAERYEADNGNGTMTVVSGDEFSEGVADYVRSTYQVSMRAVNEAQHQAAITFISAPDLWADDAYQEQTAIFIATDEKQAIAEAIVKELDPASQRSGHFYTDGQTVYYSEPGDFPQWGDTAVVRVDLLIAEDDRGWCSPDAEDTEDSEGWDIAVGNALASIPARYDL